jgi:hypothetical protein
MVVGGVGVASISPSASAMASHAAASIQPQHVIMCLISFAFPALATITKESIFRASATHLKGQQLDVLVVNSYCSAAQLLFVPLLLPLSATLQGLQLSQLPRMLADGTRCLAGVGRGRMGYTQWAAAYLKQQSASGQPSDAWHCPGLTASVRCRACLPQGNPPCVAATAAVRPCCRWLT